MPVVAVRTFKNIFSRVAQVSAVATMFLPCGCADLWGEVSTTKKSLARYARNGLFYFSAYKCYRI